MTEHMFGVSRDKPTRREARRWRRIAKKSGAHFVETSLRGVGYQCWFYCNNLGPPFTTAIEKSVLEEIAR